MNATERAEILRKIFESGRRVIDVSNKMRAITMAQDVNKPYPKNLASTLRELNTEIQKSVNDVTDAIGEMNVEEPIQIVSPCCSAEISYDARGAESGGGVYRCLECNAKLRF